MSNPIFNSPLNEDYKIMSASAHVVAGDTELTDITAPMPFNIVESTPNGVQIVGTIDLKNYTTEEINNATHNGLDIKKAKTKEEASDMAVEAFRSLLEKKPARQVPTNIDEQSRAPVIAANPTKLVHFEFEGFGSIEVAYHELEITDRFIILGYKQNWTGGMKFFPQVDGEKQFTMDVYSSDFKYEARNVGIQFPFVGYDVCILIKDEEIQK